MTKLNLKKTPGFGIGKKSSYDKLSNYMKNMPGPTTYNILSAFHTPNHSIKRGFSFTNNHSAYLKVYNEADPPK